MAEEQNRALRRPDADTDLMRVVAAFFVVMIHSSGAFTPASLAYNAAARFSVPVFLIISGYYMLARPHAGEKLAKRCCGLLARMLAWSAIYFVYDLLCGVRVWEGVGGLLTYLLTQPFHLWYFWALIALYLFTPPLFVFCEHASQREFRYALLLAFLFGSPVVILLRAGVAPVLATVVDRMKVPYLLGFPFYYLLGGYLRRYDVAEPGRRRAIYALGVLGTAVSVAGTVLLSPPGGIDDLLMSFFAPNVAAAAAAFFLLGKHWRALRRDAPSPLLHELAECTPGVYLLHPLIFLMIQRSPALEAVLYRPPASLFLPLRTALVFLLATAAVLALRRVPLLRRLVAAR